MPGCGERMLWPVLVSRYHEGERETGGPAVGDEALSGLPVGPLLWSHCETLDEAPLIFIRLPVASRGARMPGKSSGHLEQLRTVHSGPCPAPLLGLCEGGREGAGLVLTGLGRKREGA